MALQLGAVEDAIVTRAKAVLGAKVRQVDSLPADIDDEALKRLLRVTPGVFVVFDGGADPDAGGSEAKLKAQWSVTAVTAHASGEKARRRGDAVQAGAYELIETLIPALHRLTVTGIGTFAFERIENRYDGELDKQGVAVYSAVFSMQINFPGFADPSGLAPFTDALVTTNLPGSPSNPASVQDVKLPQ